MNKSAILISIIAFLTISCFSQEQKGKFFIGGLAEISFYNEESEGDIDYRKSNSIRWSTGLPFGFFVSDHILIGLSPGFSRNNSSTEFVSSYSDGTQENESILYTIGPFVRGYFNISEKVDFFLDWDAVFGIGTESSYRYYLNSGTNTQTNGKTTIFSTGISPGISVQLSKWLFMDASIGRIGYGLNRYKPDNKSDADEERKFNSFSFNFNTFRFGLSAKLGK